MVVGMNLSGYGSGDGFGFEWVVLVVGGGWWGCRSYSGSGGSSVCVVEARGLLLGFRYAFCG